jgi:tape measure domain-containing protein
MADIGTAYIRIAPNMSGVQGKIAGGLKGSGSSFADQFGGEVSNKSAVITGAIAGAVASVANRAMDIVSQSIGDAVARVDTLNAFPKVLKAMGISSDDAKAATDKLNKSLQGLPTRLQDGASGVQQFIAAGLPAGKATDTYLAMNNALLAAGGNAQDTGIVMDSLTRALSGGTTEATTIQAALSRMPTALQGLEKATGKSAGELYKLYAANPNQLAEDLVNLNKNGGGGLASLDAQAREATGGINTGFANMQTAISRGMADIINSIGQANISGALSKAGKAFEDVFKIVASGIKFMIDHKDIFAPIAVAIGTIVTALAAWAAITKTMTIVQALFNAVMAMNPIGLIIIAIAGLVAGLVYFFTQTELGKQVFQAFGQILSAVFNGIISAVQSVGNFFSSVFSGIQAVVSGVIDWIKNNWQLLLAILTGPIGIAVLLVTSHFQQIKDFIGGVVSSIGGFFSGLWNGIINGVSNMFNNVVGFFTSLPGKILSVVGNLGNTLYNAGKDLINGLLNGAGSLISTIGKFFLDKLPGWIQGPFKSALGIHSPSTVFAGFGGNITEGLVQGLNKGQSMVTGAVGNITDSVLAPLSGSINPAYAPSGATVGGNGSGQVAGGAAIVQNNSIYNQVDLDTVTRELAWQIRR